MRQLPLSIIAILALFLTFSLVACSNKVTKRVIADFSIGTFSGTGGESLNRELRNLKSHTLRKNQYPVLSGVADFKIKVSDAKETVITTEDGAENLYWHKDPLTGETWMIKARVKKEVPKDFDFVNLSGELTVSWTLKDPKSGKTLQQGTDTIHHSKSLGGYLKNQKLLKEDYLTEAEENLLEALTRSAALSLVETLGPGFTDYDLARANDPFSTNAKTLVFYDHWDEASVIWKELLTLNPSYHPALFNLGLYYEQQGDLISAWTYFRQAFIQNQSIQYRDALTRLTSVLRQKGLLPRRSSDSIF
jgi:tetratricopeptide (TPR) repeat protein